MVKYHQKKTVQITNSTVTEVTITTLLPLIQFVLGTNFVNNDFTTGAMHGSGKT
jgi:hypothetical protein